MATGWPRAGWGPGSLTVSRPPQASGPVGTTVSAAAVTAALNAAASGGTGEGAGRGGGGVLSTASGRRHYDSVATDANGVAIANQKRGVVIDSPPPPTHEVVSARAREEEEGGGGAGGGEGRGETGEGGDVAGRLLPRPGTAPMEREGDERGPEMSPEDLTGRPTDPSKMPHEGEPTREGEENEQSSIKKRENTRPEDDSPAEEHHEWGELDDFSRQSHDDLSLSGGMLLRDLDGSTLEPPSPEPPSPERQGSPGTDTGSDGDEQQRQRRDTRGTRKRTMTSQYVR